MATSTSGLKDDTGVRVFELGELKEFGLQKLAEAHAAVGQEAGNDFDYGHSS